MKRVFSLNMWIVTAQKLQKSSGYVYYKLSHRDHVNVSFYHVAAMIALSMRVSNSKQIFSVLCSMCSFRLRG